MHQDERHAAARGDFRNPGIVPQPGNVIDNLRAGIQRGLRHFGLLRVDRNRNLEQPAKPPRTGKTLRSSSSMEISSEPGLVDSPPTSIKSAPARSICTACCIACSSAKNFPPSEKLSGVTFSTPITSVRSPRTSLLEHSRRLNFFLELIRRNRRIAK